MKNSIKGHAYRQAVPDGRQAGFAPLIIILAIAAVLVVGYAVWSITRPWTPESKNLTNQQVTGQSTSTINTSDWKTYTNAQYAFEFKYPADAEIKINNSIGLYGYQVAGVDVNVSPNFIVIPNDNAIKQFEVTASPNQSTCTAVPSESSQKTINGISYTVAPWTNAGGTQTWSSAQLLDSVYNGICYQIKESISGRITSVAQNYNLNQEKQVFDQIFSTFKFTKITSTTQTSYSSNSATASTASKKSTISYINPTSAKVGDTITVYGTNFDNSSCIALDSNVNSGPSIIPIYKTTTVLKFVIPLDIRVGPHKVQECEPGEREFGFLSNPVTLNIVAP